MAICVLYDGWWLATQPNSPPALHLLNLLAHCPAEVEKVVAVPALPAEPLPNDVTVHLQAGRGSGVLRWEQRTIPQLGHALRADLVHLAGSNPALWPRRGQLLSPAGDAWPPIELAGPTEPRPSLATRLSDAMGQGGMSRLRGLLWPEDLPDPAGKAPVFRLPRVTLPAFQPAGPTTTSLGHIELPESYLLYHGSLRTSDMQRLLHAWSWAAGAIGQAFPLLVVGVDEAARARLLPILRQAGCENTVRLLPPVKIADLAAVYRGCGALFHPSSDSPWEGAIPLAMACGKPVVALEAPWSDALVGPAGYLVPDGEPGSVARLLGAALITVVVEESVSDQLAGLAMERSAPWRSPHQAQRFCEGLLAAYASASA
jgi:glycosyltransferase involved in cell wall biosynthesis